MIKQIYIKNARGKINWIDQNSTVVGFDNYTQCCEEYGWKVVDNNCNNITDKIDPNTVHFGTSNQSSTIYKDEYKEAIDVDGVELLDDETNNLVGFLQFYNCHNGYYCHDFGIKTNFKLTEQDAVDNINNVCFEYSNQ